MPVNKRKKASRLRGSMTYGWGSKKKHRGSGNRGGFGMAGTGKRADQKKPSIINDYGLKNYFGKHGFNIHPKRKRLKVVNLSFLDSRLGLLVKDKLASLDNGHYSVDLSSLGYDKLLATGRITKKLKITAKHFSKNAVRKIEEAGGIAVVK